MVIKINYTSSDVYVSTSVSPVYVVVNYSAVNNGGGAVWGGITGTLSDQTDLQDALDDKVPYTGATANVNLGEHGLTAGQLTLDTTPTGTAVVGTTRWNDAIGSSETTLKGGSVILKNGVDLVARIVNKVTPNTTLTKAAYQAVRVSGAQGQRLAVAFAQANNDANSADTIGLVTETIPTNQEGFIITVGQLEGINTTGSLQGETWADGDVLYLSPTTPGAITKVKPTGAGHIVVIGYVEYAHQNNGKIYVKVMNGWELDELHDVSIVSPANNEALIYESSTSLWKNKTIATALGYTPVPTTRTLTINGTAFDLSADRSWTIAAGITGSGVANQLTYWNGTGSVTGSAGLVYNDSTGIMTLSKNKNGISYINVSNTTSGGAAAAGLTFTNNLSANEAQLFLTSTTYTPYRGIGAGDFGIYKAGAGDITFYHDFSTGKIKFAAGNAATAQMTLTAAGRLLLGTTTESTFIFDAVGNARVSGSLTTISANPINVTESNSSTGESIVLCQTVGQARFIGLRARNSSFGGDLANRVFIQAPWGTYMTTNLAGQPSFSDVSQTWHQSKSVTFNAATEYASAQVAIDSTTKGFLQPRMTTVQRDAIASPATGLSVYNTTTNTNDFYNGTSWSSLASGNIYTVDGTLTGNRTVTMSGRSLTFSGGNIVTNNQIAVQGFTDFTGISGMALILSMQSNNGVIGTYNPTTNTYGNTIIGNLGTTYLGTWSTYNGGGNVNISSRLEIRNGSGVIDPLILKSPNNTDFIYQKFVTNTIERFWIGYQPIFGAFTLYNPQNTTAALTVFNSTSNVSINSTTDAGFRLDVNGTARFTGIVNLQGSYTNIGSVLNFGATNDGANYSTSGTGYLFATSVGTNANTPAFVLYSGSIAPTSGITNLFGYNIVTQYNPSSGNATLNFINIGSGGGNSATINTTGTYSGTIRGYYFNPTLTSTTGATIRAIETTVGDVLLCTTSGSVGVGANTSINASAILDITSTTKGFLPPRMTTTQKNAISSPAAGLQVYDTTLNQMSYYNGTTWVNF